jgi:hypothetical protein
MEDVASLTFLDAQSDDEACVIVRAAPGVVAIAVSLRADGDLEVCLPVTSARALVSALERALTVSAASG